MIPSTAENNWKSSLARDLSEVRARLDALGHQERLTRFLHALGSWVGAVALLLLVSCLIDDLWDRFQGTPLFGLWMLRLIWVSGAAILAWRWLIPAWWEPISRARLAVSIETEVGGLNHELVTALEYLEGRPPSAHPLFIEEIARHGASQALSGSWTSALPTGRLRSGVLVALLGLAPLAGLLAWDPNWMGALLGRQLGLSLAVPRALRIELPTRLILPEGEPGKVTAQVVPVDPGGPLRIVFEGAGGEVRRWNLDEASGREINLPGELSGGHLLAHLGYYRSEKLELIRVVRPVLSLRLASVTLPDWVGRRPDGSAFPGEGNAGDLGGWLGSRVEVTIESTLPLEKVRLRVLKTEGSSGSISREIPVELDAGGQSFVARWTLEEGDRFWQAEGESLDHQPSKTPLRRTIDVWQPTPPRVEWLPELMIPGSPETLFAGRSKQVALRQAFEENEVDGIPVPMGGRFRLAYTVSSRAGLSQARMVYRINGAQAWKSFPLPEVSLPSNQGEFLPEFGVFEKTPAEGEVPFFAQPTSDPTLSPGRLKGGGRFDFRITPIKDLKAGDRIEFGIEVEDRHQPPQVGRSAIRVKDVVNLEDFLAWWARKEKEQEKLRELRLRQGRVFEGFLPGSR